MSYFSSFSNNIRISFVDSDIVKLLAYHTLMVEDIYHLKIIPKTMCSLRTNSLQRIMVSCSVFFLTVTGPAYTYIYILLSQFLQQFTASVTLHIKLRTWWSHMDLSNTKFPLCFPSSLRYNTQNTHYFYICLKRKKQIIWRIFLLPSILPL